MVVFFDYSESMSKVLDTVEPIKEVSTNDEKVQIINVLIEEYLFDRRIFKRVYIPFRKF